jgi:hypothetical protein
MQLVDLLRTGIPGQINKAEAKAVPLYAMEALGGREDIAPHS